MKDQQPHHVLKLDPAYFDDVKHGTKRFEVRLDDRHYEIGDLILLREWADGEFTGRGIPVEVIYKLDGGQHGVAAGYCVLGIDLRRGDSAS